MKTLAAAAVLVACAGCSTVAPASWAGGAGGGTRTSTDHGPVSRGTANLTRNGKPYLVLLTAGCEPTSVTGGPWGGGLIKALDGREVKWSCDTWDGVTGRLIIGGEKFRLDHGAVVFIDMRDGKVVTEQVAVDMQQFDGGPVEERLKVIATTNEQIARFLAACDLPR
jgi:hypothetical protein